jgi:hypothetical protein
MKWYDELPPGKSWATLWTGYILCGELPRDIVVYSTKITVSPCLPSARLAGRQLIKKRDRHVYYWQSVSVGICPPSMPRAARAAVGGVCYHVINWGNGRRQVFHTEGGYHAFVLVGKLRVGEQVRTACGVAAITPIKHRPRGEWVYNLEAQGERVYQVGETGVLVHNNNRGALAT